MHKSTDMPHSHADLIGAADAAEILGVGRSTVTRWAESGRLPTALRLPGETGALLFRRSDVEALLTPSEPDGAA